MERHIHILGLGNIGKFVAHVLRKQSPTTAVTLLMHRESLLRDWEGHGESIECINGDGAVEKSSGFAAEIPVASVSPIKYLIVATKAYMTVEALATVKHRLGPDSSILFLQNGMGTTDEVSTHLFPDMRLRPTYWAGIASFGVYSRGSFSIVHAGRGSLVLGALERQAAKMPCSSSQFPSYSPFSYSSSSSSTKDSTLMDPMVQRLRDAEDLTVTVVTPDVIRAIQLQKLAANAIINPLTATIGCLNGEVFSTPARLSILKHLVSETGAVIRALLPARLDEDWVRRFSDEHLCEYVRDVASKTAKNSSSMLQDLGAGRRTEIDYINGYVVKQAQRLGLAHEYNARLADWVRQQKRAISDKEIAGLVLESCDQQ